MHQVELVCADLFQSVLEPQINVMEMLQTGLACADLKQNVLEIMLTNVTEQPPQEAVYLQKQAAPVLKSG